jgi:hypothetical protein
MVWCLEVTVVVLLVAHAGLPGSQMGMTDYGAITGLSGLAGAAGLNSFNAALASNLNNGLADYQVSILVTKHSLLLCPRTRHFQVC